MNPVINRAVVEIIAGRLIVAQVILERYLLENHKDLDGWYCLYSCLSSYEQKKKCLQRILNVDPNDRYASIEYTLLIKNGESYFDFPIIAQAILSSKRPAEDRVGLSSENSEEKLASAKTMWESNVSKHLSKDFINPDPPSPQKPQNIDSRSPAKKKNIQDRDTIRSSNKTRKQSVPLTAKNKSGKKVKQKPKDKNKSDDKYTPSENKEQKDNDADTKSADSKIIIKSPPPTRMHKSIGENVFAPARYKLNSFIDIDSGMYGNRLMIGGIGIRADDQPQCLDITKRKKDCCPQCEFFAIDDCPILNDVDLSMDAISLFGLSLLHARERKLRNMDSALQAQRQKLRKIDIVNAIYTELKAHGRPLNYELLTKIVRDRYPHFQLRANSIIRIMSRHPEKFDYIGAGVYKAR